MLARGLLVLFFFFLFFRCERGMDPASQGKGRQQLEKAVALHSFGGANGRCVFQLFVFHIHAFEMRTRETHPGVSPLNGSV